MTIAEENEARRREFCRPIRGPFSATQCFPAQDFDDDQEIFACSLGTLGCTEGHGEWELAWVQKNQPKRSGFALLRKMLRSLDDAR